MKRTSQILNPNGDVVSEQHLACTELASVSSIKVSSRHVRTKKNPKVKLENYCRLFLLLGLVATLLAVYLALERETKSQVTSQHFEKTMYQSNEDVAVLEVIVAPEEVTPVAAVKPPPILEDIVIIANDDIIEESVLESTETSETEAIVLKEILPIENIQEVEILEEVQEDVPFRVIEMVPVYPGCTGNRAALSACLEQRIREHIAANFNADLAQDLGLAPGKMRIFVQFVIDKNGTIVSIRSRAPHKSLEKEAIRVVKSIPKMQAGTQRGKPVGVRYNLPIIFEIIE